MICSCSGKPERSRKPVIAVQLSPSVKNFFFGQSVSLDIEVKIKNGKLKKVNVYFNNQLITSEEKETFSCSISNFNILGNNNIRIVAEKTDGVSNIRNLPVTILSDSPPVKYEYTVIRDYSHSRENFTQGLQLHNGFLYEGTGENGKSFIYKINLSKNSVIQKVALPEKYFGEGITILNDKIYQLTYKHQSCFVYRLSDFALIDSFKFVSAEGWGLTNDGKSLIMSDGTGFLSWINPVSYVLEKTIQVADQEKILQYINELEYSEGYIWANIWTTDQIIRIDATSGKVVGFLDMRGLLGVMNSNSSERIDVMNGIAVIPDSGHLLITGKLWPKLYEIKVNSLK
jgi:glutamine cyclotransferase